MRRRRITLVEVFVISGVAVALVGIIYVIGSSRRHHSSGSANRPWCMSNLRQIGLATILYANDNDNSLPWLDAAAGEPVRMFTGALGPRLPNDVTAAWLLPFQTQELSMERAVCPSTDQPAWDDPDVPATLLTNWPGPQYLSYSFQNPYPAASADGWRWDATLGSDDPLAADQAPRTLAAVTYQSSTAEMKGANSPNHNRNGQNVMYADGHVDFEATPFMGVRDDFIYAGRREPASEDEADFYTLPPGSPWNKPADRFDTVMPPLMHRR